MKCTETDAPLLMLNAPLDNGMSELFARVFPVRKLIVLWPGHTVPAL